MHLPKHNVTKKQAAEILDKAFDEHDFKDNFLAKHVPGRTLLKECIAQGQEEILLTLLSKVTQKILHSLSL